MQTIDKTASGFSSRLNVRAPVDLMPRIQVHAFRRGLSASAWVRLLILDALDQAERQDATAVEQKSAA